MRRKTYLLLFLLIILNELVFGKHTNKAKFQAVHKKLSDLKGKSTNRFKRSINEDTRYLVLSDSHDKGIKNNHDHVHSLTKRKTYFDVNMEDEPPFWGNRGRRESFESIQSPINSKYNGNLKAYKLISRLDAKKKQDEDSPFWGNRGRRDSGESRENDLNFDYVSWRNSDSKQEDEPFWGTRGRREEYPFWGNRGRRQNFLIKSDDYSPFWGNRERREEPEPFWGNRGRREFVDPFWGSRGKKEQENHYLDEMEPFWGNRGRRKSEEDESSIEPYNLQDKLDSETQKRVTSFWGNRGRNSKIKYLFNAPARLRMQYTPPQVIDGHNYHIPISPFQQNTVGDHRIYAEQLHYILLERSSRSSGEIDPFFISRGKKFSEFELFKAARDRRGAIEEIVKSVRNDPYYIARGKKDLNAKMGNITSLQDDILKTKQLLCAAINVIMTKQDVKQKREVSDINERDRRTILKKLALQLQMDPYFVSRGKKDSKPQTRESLEYNMNQLLEICS